MDNFSFKDLLVVTPQSYDPNIDPLGLNAYRARKRRLGVLGESVEVPTKEFLVHLKKLTETNNASYIVALQEDSSKKIIVSLGDSEPFGVSISESVCVVPREFILSEALTMQQRMKRRMLMRRLAPRIARARKIAMRKRAPLDVLKRRAIKAARSKIAKKMLGGRDKSTVSPAEKTRIEKILAKRGPQIQRMATKLLPIIRKRQADRFAKKKTPQANTSTNS